MDTPLVSADSDPDPWVFLATWTTSDTDLIEIIEPTNTLQHLSLLGQGIDNDGASAIAANLTQLTNLNLSHNQIGNDGASAIAANLTQLTNLDLSDNQISTLSVLMPAIEHGLQMAPSSRSRGLHIAENPISDPPLEILGQGTDALVGYYTDLAKQGGERLLEAKVMLVG